MLQCLESQHSVSFTNDDLQHWTSNHVDALLSSGILQQGSLAEEIECDGCEKQCITEVDLIQDDNSSLPRAYVYCMGDDEIGRVEVLLGRLKVWDANLKKLVDYLCSALNTTSPPDECLQDRLWWLGGARINHRRADIFLARGSTWSDAKDVFGECSHISGCSNPLILVLSDIPEGKLFGLSSKVASLNRLLSFDGSSLVLDTAEVSELLNIPKVIATIPKDIFEPLDNDYSLIRYHDSVLPRLSKRQAVIVRLLHEQYELGHEKVAWGSLIFPENMDHPGKMTDIFRPGDDRGVLIVKVDKGVYRLNL